MKTLLPELPAAYRPLAERARVQPTAFREAGQPAARWWEVKAAAGEDQAELYIYDAIAWYAVDAGEVVRELARLDVGTIHVRINSPGGEVFGGVAIYNALVRHRARVVVHVDGVAASIASIIAMAGDEIRMGGGSFMMIHAPWVLAIGNAPELREVADWLDKIGASMAGIYAERSGLPLAEVTALMETDTWLTADEAEAKGFADALDEEAAAEARFDLSAYANVPEKLASRAEDRPAPKNEREAEKVLREAGLSRSDAKAIIAAVKKADPEPRDAREGKPAGDAAAAEGLLATLTLAIAETATLNLRET